MATFEVAKRLGVPHIVFRHKKRNADSLLAFRRPGINASLRLGADM